MNHYFPLKNIVEIRVSQNIAELGGGGRGEGNVKNVRDRRGERIGVNCVAWEGRFQH